MENEGEDVLAGRFPREAAVEDTNAVGDADQVIP